MKGCDLIEVLKCHPVFISDSNFDIKELNQCFATDLMSDALAMLVKDNATTILLTGLCNGQSLRTAEMLDIQTIVYCRDKKMSDADLSLAKQMSVNLLSTEYTMFEACGRLYQAGFKGYHD